MDVNVKRAVQIDLARQIETMPTVFRFFDVAHVAGMNMVFLYLEDRIKTKSYPYSPDSESYLPEQIRQMVEYADKLGLELVPIVSGLGHVERFMRHPELAHLAELHGNIEGCFTEAGQAPYKDVCPSKRETYEFFDTYLTEIAELFPSAYFHAGYDEVFDIGYCDLCKPIAEKEGMGNIFLQHMLHTHHLLSSKGKRMLIWDDMFEEYPQILQELPRDIIICSWHYNFIDRRPEGQFNNRKREDSFKLYEDLGFSYFGATFFSVANIDTFTDYAERHNPTGMLLTIWEMSAEQLTLIYPIIMYAGMLWNDDTLLPSAERLVRATEILVGSHELAEVLSIGLSTRLKNPLFSGVRKAIELPCLDDHRQDEICMLVESKLLDFHATDSQKQYIDAVLGRIQFFRISYRISLLAYRFFEFRTGERKTDIPALLAELVDCKERLHALYQRQKELWESVRPGMPSPDLDAKYKRAFIAIDQIIEDVQSSDFGEIGRLDVHFAYPDQTSSVKTKITLHFEDRADMEVANAKFKAHDFKNPYFSYAFPIPADSSPSAVSIEVSGYGSTGIAYVDVTTLKGCFVPGEVVETIGHTENAHYLLVDDARAAVLGEPEVQYSLKNHSRKKDIHLIRLCLKTSSV